MTEQVNDLSLTVKNRQPPKEIVFIEKAIYQEDQTGQQTETKMFGL